MNVDVAVVGGGMIGSAAARYLAMGGARVTIIGAPEPTKPHGPDQVYGSHYDQGRLARRLSKDALWVRMTTRALDVYPRLEKAAGIPFYRAVGCLHVSGEAPDASRAVEMQGVAEKEAIPYHFYPAGDDGWREKAFGLNFPAACHVLYEPAPAGMINPRALVQAQLRVAEQHGATLLRETVIDVTENERGVTLATSQGTTLHAQRVLIAAGGFTNFHNLLPCPLPLTLKGETVILGEVTAETAAALADMPILTYQIDHPQLSGIYMTPPVLYPDGRFYVKMGCNFIGDIRPQTLAEVQQWFRRGGGEDPKPAMAQALQAILPDVAFISLDTRRCLICYTPGGAPIIDALSTRICVAAGGNGSSAKCSDTLGRLAAGLMQGDPWPAAFDRERFRAR